MRHLPILPARWASCRIRHPDGRGQARSAVDGAATALALVVRRDALVDGLLVGRHQAGDGERLEAVDELAQLLDGAAGVAERRPHEGADDLGELVGDLLAVAGVDLARPPAPPRAGCRCRPGRSARRRRGRRSTGASRERCRAMSDGVAVGGDALDVLLDRRQGEAVALQLADQLEAGDVVGAVVARAAASYGRRHQAARWCRSGRCARSCPTRSVSSSRVSSSASCLGGRRSSVSTRTILSSAARLAGDPVGWVTRATPVGTVTVMVSQSSRHGRSIRLRPHPHTSWHAARPSAPCTR